ncbi:MAG: methyltransferase, TIGR04325 family [Polaribacter sp.]
MKLIKRIVQKFKNNKSKKNGSVWSSAFKTWEESLLVSSGYDSNFILELCKNALLKVKNGEAAFERDSTVFDKVSYNFKVLAALQNVCIENKNNLSVLDFGGSLGSKYFQNKLFFQKANLFEWSIVEQKHFVETGKTHFKDSFLDFFFTINSCISVRKPNVILLNSVLQYLENPYKILKELLETNVETIVIDRTAFIDVKEDLICVQNVPSYKAKIPHWFFSIEKFQLFLEKFNKKIIVEDVSDIQFNNSDLQSISKFLIIK